MVFRGREPAEALEAPLHHGDVTTSTFSHSDRDMHVTVEKPQEGCMCTLSMYARVPLAPDRLYALLVHPAECMRIFKSLKRVRHRRILADDGKGNRRVEVDQTGAWRFLMFRGSFTVRMIVEQRASDRTIIFNLAKPGFMRVFGGTWTIRPYDNASLDQLVNKHRPSALHRLQAGVRAVEAGLGMGGRTEESLVQLQQSIAPAFRPPPAVARVMQRIAAKQIQKIMTDLQDEVRRINTGASSVLDGKEWEDESSSGGGAATGEERRRDTEGKGQGGQRQEGQPPPAAKARQPDKKQLAAHVAPLR